MHRQARERIITLELMKLERRQLLERERRSHEGRVRPAAGTRQARPSARTSREA